MSDTRQHVHELIDQLPPTQLSALARLLEAMLDPVANAPIDDEPVNEEDRRRFKEGLKQFAEGERKGVAMEDVLAEFGQ